VWLVEILRCAPQRRAAVAGGVAGRVCGSGNQGRGGQAQTESKFRNRGGTETEAIPEGLVRGTQILRGKREEHWSSGRGSGRSSGNHGECEARAR